MQRDLVKTISFAVIHLAVGFTVSYAFKGSVAIASGIALVEPLVNTVVFYFHERGWNRFGGRFRTALAGSKDPAWRLKQSHSA